ncbi:MAG: sigma-70 family RNA polymerase sigma factor [Planctomycetes bacterium]|nr:sigma-70 family RNA polymerase sigma factor [Planctomycetota bacterium]
MDDLDQLMTGAQQGDAEAFAAVVERCQHLVRAVLLRETADADLADELAQDALVRAWELRAQYRPGTSPRAWIITIARSRLIEHHRRRDRDRRHLSELVRQELLRHRPAEDEGHDAERLGALRTCLEGLGEEHRRLLALVHGDGVSGEEAAAALGLSPEACRQRLSRLQRKLRACADQRLEQTRG